MRDRGEDLARGPSGDPTRRGADDPSRSPRRLSFAVSVLVITASLALVQVLEPPERTLAWIAFFDAGHAPIFGVIALAMLQIFSAKRVAIRGLWLPYVLALGATLAAGALSEWMQIGTAHESDPRDLARNALGASAFLLGALSCDSRARATLGSRRASRVLLRGAALALLALALAPSIAVALAYGARARAFPALCDFAGTWERRFVAVRFARLEFTRLARPGGAALAAAHVQYEAAPFAAFKLVEPYPNWTGRAQLRLVAELEAERPIDLVLRVNDRDHDGFYSDRFNRSLTFAPGRNEFRIPLAEIRSAPETREMDLSAIRRVSLFAVDPSEPISLYLLELALE